MQSIQIVIVSVTLLVSIALAQSGAAGSSTPASSSAPASGSTSASSSAPASAPASRVVRENGSAKISGVPLLAWGKAEECTFLGSLAAALQATDHPATYEDLMGFSGMAFRIRWYRGQEGQRWCPSSPVGEFPEESAAVQAATGWKLDAVNKMGQDKPDMSDCRERIVESINNGLPVLAYGTQMDMGVISGYRDGGNVLLFHNYHSGKIDDLPIAEVGPMLMFLQEWRQPPAKEKSFVEGIRIGVRNWDRKPLVNPQRKGEYLYGQAALAGWIEDLQNASTLSDSDKQLLCFVTWWNFNGLVDARTAAARYLERNAELVSSPIGTQRIIRAIKLYQAQSRKMMRCFLMKDAFLGPWSGKSVEAWTDAVRQKEIEVLTDALEADQAAIESLKAALPLISATSQRAAQ